MEMESFLHISATEHSLAAHHIPASQYIPSNISAVQHNSILYIPASQLIPSNVSSSKLLDNKYAGSEHAYDSSTMSDNQHHKMDPAVAEVLGEELDKLGCLSGLGHFREALPIATGMLEEHTDNFAVLVIYLGLLDNQGDYKTLVKTVDSRMIKFSEDDVNTHAWMDVDQIILRLYGFIGRLYIHGFTRSNFEVAEVSVKAALRWVPPIMERLDEWQMVIAMLVLRIAYLKHETMSTMPMTFFSLPWNQDNSKDALCPLVKFLMQGSYYYTADSILEICFRRTSAEHYVINYEAIWISIAWFATVVGPNDSQDDLFEKVGFLQTFCEGLLRRDAYDIKLNASNTSHWSSAQEHLDRMISLISERSKPEIWTSSRAYSRQKLLILDKIMAESHQHEDAILIEQFEILHELQLLTVRQQDMRMRSAVEWRIDALGEILNLTNTLDPIGLVPFQLYHTHQKLMTKDERPKADEVTNTSRRSWKVRKTRSQSNHDTAAVSPRRSPRKRLFSRREKD